MDAPTGTTLMHTSTISAANTAAHTSHLISRPVAIGAGLMLAGFLGGALVGEARTVGRAHIAGACIALQHSVARGAMSEHAVDVVLHDLVDSQGLLRVSFPVSAHQFRTQCAEVSRITAQLGVAHRDAGIAIATH